jgi:methyl-accepting chemotaxis protein
MEQMKSNISQNADNAEQTEELRFMPPLGGRERKGGPRRPSSAIKTIANKISIIEEISRQTNMLSRNAPVKRRAPESTVRGSL